MTWNQHRATVDATQRTNNVCEGWNNAFASVIGHQHPSLRTLLGALQQDQALLPILGEGSVLGLSLIHI